MNAENTETGKRSKCGMCGYVGTLTDHIGQCPRCHWDELAPASPDDRDPVHETPAQMARWRDAWGQKYDGPAGNYVPGQFSPTGAQMIRFLPPNT